ncbi:MAG: DUF3667 domain-containing protein [Rhizorhabdus sp.]|nr:DUF3667 domain-containing protein [Rhizorhabdus sp.]MBP8235022.1 DUF3667 domain-containing protein [Rhizorhabdus sp.]
MADMATGTVVARTIDGAGKAEHGARDDHRGDCLNCGTALIGPHCHRCGQSAHVHRTASALFHDIAHGVFHFEGRTWHTLPLLFWRPGELTRRYIRGERITFVSPMALFLFSVFLMVAVFGLVGGPFGPMRLQGDPVKLAEARTEAAKELAGVEKRIATLAAEKQARNARGEKTPDLNEQLGDLRSEQAALRLVTTGQIRPPKADDVEGLKLNIDTGVPAIDLAFRHLTRNPELTAYKMQSTAYKFSWALIPISLPFIWLLFAFRRDVGLYDHAVFATYSLSAMTLMVIGASVLAGIGISLSLTFFLMVFFPPWHMYRQLKGAYGLSGFGAFWRMVALILSAYTAALIFVVMLLAMGA